jgi:hypothetical protein
VPTDDCEDERGEQHVDHSAEAGDAADPVRGIIRSVTTRRATALGRQAGMSSSRGAETQRSTRATRSLCGSYCTRRGHQRHSKDSRMWLSGCLTRRWLVVRRGEKGGAATHLGSFRPLALSYWLEYIGIRYEGPADTRAQVRKDQEGLQITRGFA